MVRGTKLFMKTNNPNSNKLCGPLLLSVLCVEPLIVVSDPRHPSHPSCPSLYPLIVFRNHPRHLSLYPLIVFQLLFRLAGGARSLRSRLGLGSLHPAYPCILKSCSTTTPAINHGVHSHKCHEWHIWLCRYCERGWRSRHLLKCTAGFILRGCEGVLREIFRLV